jgi:hypothetical protein
MNTLARIVCCALLLLPALLRAESSDFGDYTVHYQAVNSTFLTAKIASQYGIERNQRTAFLNIAVLHNNDDGSTTPVTAVLKGGKRNLLQQGSDIAFREIREGDAIYYIGEFDISDAEILRFAVEVQPEGKGPVHTLQWSTQLYVQ